MLQTLSEPSVRVKKECINQNEVIVLAILLTTIYILYLTLYPS